MKYQYLNDLTSAIVLTIALICAIASINYILNITLFIAAIILLCKKNTKAVIISLGFCGSPILLIMKNTFDYTVTHVFIGAIAFLIILLIFDKKHSVLNPRSNYYNYLFWFLAVLTMINLSFFFSDKTEYQKYYIQFFMVYSLFWCFCGVIVVKFRISIVDLLLPSIFFFAFSYQYAVNSNVNLFFSDLGFRGMEEINAMYLGRTSGHLVILCFLSFFESVNTKRDKMFFPELLVALILALPILWLSQARQGIYGVFIGIVAYIVCAMLWKDRDRQSLRKSNITVALSILSLLYVFLFWALRKFPQTRISDLSILEDGRFFYWSEAIKGFFDNMLFGNGLGGFFEKYFIYPHNWILEICYDYGLIGMALFFIPIVAMLLTLLTSKKHFKHNWLILGIYWLFVSFASSDMPRNTQLFLFFVIAMIPMWKKSKKSKSDQKDETSFYHA